MLTIQNLDKIINTHPTTYKWHISDAFKYADLYVFDILNNNLQTTFYLNRESQYMSGRNEPVYRLYKDFHQRWLSLHQISPYFIKELIDKMLNE
jgi:hypothetical protein